MSVLASVLEIAILVGMKSIPLLEAALHPNAVGLLVPKLLVRLVSLLVVALMLVLELVLAAWLSTLLLERAVVPELVPVA